MQLSIIDMDILLEQIHEKETQLAEIKKHLVNYFSGQPEVAAVYLFGSFPLLKDTPSSDIDLAILTPPLSHAQSYQLRLRYYVDLSRYLKREIDIVLLREAGELLTFQVFKYGRLILEKDPACHSRVGGLCPPMTPD